MTQHILVLELSNDARRSQNFVNRHGDEPKKGIANYRTRKHVDKLIIACGVNDCVC